MPELITRKAVPQINYYDVPKAYQPTPVFTNSGRLAGWKHRVSAVCRSLEECSELVRWFGDATFMPYLPVLVKAPAGWTAITGWGYADAAELQDCAVVLWNRQTEALAANHGSLFNYDELRERNGLMRSEDVAAAMADALTRKIASHKASPVTDPFRQTKYPRWRGRTVHTVAKIEEKS